MQQGEQLDNVERKTASINQQMKTSQKHINNIKSVFGGLKNWWSGKKEEPKEEAERQPREPSSRLQASVDEHRDNNPHPAMRIRGDASGFYNDEDFGDRFGSGSKSADVNEWGAPATNYNRGPATQRTTQPQAQTSTAMNEFDTQVDQNLG